MGSRMHKEPVVSLDPTLLGSCVDSPTSEWPSGGHRLYSSGISREPAGRDIDTDTDLDIDQIECNILWYYISYMCIKRFIIGIGSCTYGGQEVSPSAIYKPENQES